MAKYLLLKHYRGAPAAVNNVPMDQWKPDEVEAHIKFMNDFAARLESTGEFVDGQALSPDGVWVRSDGEGRPPVTDGPFAETKDLIAGWMIIDVDSYERAIELAGELSAAPGRRRRTDPRVAGGPTLHGRAAQLHALTVDDVELRELVPRVLSVLVRRGADFATAEDAVQEALIRALSAWDDDAPADPTGWLITVAWRAFLDMTRSDAARRDREVRFDTEPPAGAIPSADDTLRLYFLCAHPDLTPSSAVALTLRAVGGLTTRQIAQAYLVPEPTMAQRISRAKRVGRVGPVSIVPATCAR